MVMLPLLSTIENLEKKQKEQSNQYKIKLEQSVDKYESKLDEFERKKHEDGNVIKDEEYQCRILALEKVHADSTQKALIAVVAWK